MASKKRFDMLKESLKKVLSGNEELGNHYDAGKNTAYFYIVGNKKIDDAQKKDIVKMVRGARIDTVIGEGEKLIIINRKGVIAEDRLVNAKNFVKNIIITGKLMKRYEEESKSKRV